MLCSSAHLLFIVRLELTFMASPLRCPYTPPHPASRFHPGFVWAHLEFSHYCRHICCVTRKQPNKPLEYSDSNRWEFCIDAYFPRFLWNAGHQTFLCQKYVQLKDVRSICYCYWCCCCCCCCSHAVLIFLIQLVRPCVRMSLGRSDGLVWRDAWDSHRDFPNASQKKKRRQSLQVINGTKNIQIRLYGAGACEPTQEMPLYVYCPYS